MKKLLGFAVILVLLASCDAAKKVQETLTLSKCTFSYDKVNEIDLAGVDLMGGSINPIDIVDLGLILADGSKPLPMNLNLGILVKNPNGGNASMGRMDWILNIDSIKMVEGTVNESFQIPGKGSNIVPFIAAVDLKQVLSGKSITQIVNLVSNLVQQDSDKPSSKLSLQVRPTINVGGVPIAYPGYITVGN